MLWNNTQFFKSGLFNQPSKHFYRYSILFSMSFKKYFPQYEMKSK